MILLFTYKSMSKTKPLSHSSLINQPLLCFLLTILTFLCSNPTSQASTCRTSCGLIQIKYPFGIDDGCGSPYYRHTLACSDTGILYLRTPSGKYQVQTVSYSDPHIIVTDPSMWNCQDGNNFRPTRPFSLDTSTHLTLSFQNDYLFFNCSEEKVIMEPKPMFCERFPDRCDSTCDSSSYLCRRLPQCANALMGSSCCSYSPKATESLRLMLKNCASYTTMYWKSFDGANPNEQEPDYGIRVDFDIPVTTHCLQCQDMTKGGGTCGFDTMSQSFLCLCKDRNVTTYCKDHGDSGNNRAGVVAGTVSGVSAAGALGIGAGIWYWKKVRAKARVTCGVQSNENRLF